MYLYRKFEVYHKYLSEYLSIYCIGDFLIPIFTGFNELEVFGSEPERDKGHRINPRPTHQPRQAQSQESNQYRHIVILSSHLFN